VESNIQIIAFALILLTFALTLIVRRRTRTPQRPLAALDVLPRMTGRSIEAGEPLLVSTGSAAPGNESTLLALLGNEFIYYLTREVAIGDAAPLFTVADTAALPLALDTLSRAYSDANRPGYQAINARWYPSQSRTLAFAAAMMTLQTDDTIAGNVLVGRFATDIGLILDASTRRGRLSLAVSDTLGGQAVAYALADGALIGEELFAAPAYLDDDPGLTNRNLVIDLLRLLLIFAILGVLLADPLLNLVNGL
jgi:hypothetical protein